MKLLTIARDLRRRKGRERRALFVAEGVRAVETLLAGDLSVAGVLYTSRLADDPRGKALLERAEATEVPLLQLSDDEFESAADTDTPQGVMAVAAIPQFGLPTPSDGTRLLVLDAVQDPGNVGTIIRSAAALGVTHTVALPGTVDLWNAKVVRSAMGASYTHPTSQITWERLEAYLEQHRVPLWISDIAGEPLSKATVAPSKLALAVGNEGAGLTTEVARSAERAVSIPMLPNVESLNVAVATGILLFALTPSSSPSPLAPDATDNG